MRFAQEGALTSVDNLNGSFYSDRSTPTNPQAEWEPVSDWRLYSYPRYRPATQQENRTTSLVAAQMQHVQETPASDTVMNTVVLGIDLILEYY